MFVDSNYKFIFIRFFNIQRYCYVRQYLITKIEYFMRYGHKFSKISEMNFTFITNPNKMTYENYLNPRMEIN